MKNEYQVPNKYRENPEVNEDGVVKGTDYIGVLTSFVAIAIALVGFVLAAILS